MVLVVNLGYSTPDTAEICKLRPIVQLKILLLESDYANSVELSIH